MRLSFFPCLGLLGALLPACQCGGLVQESGFNESGPGGSGGAAAGGSGANGGGGSGAGTGASNGSGASGAGAMNGSGAGSSTGVGGSGAGANGAGASGAGASGAGASYKVYASTDTELYALDLSVPSLPLTKVGEFECVDFYEGPFSSMVDIAVDRFDDIWGITGHDVMRLIPSGGTVLCGPPIALTAEGGGGFVPTFYALTFAPVGVIYPNKEVLVGGNTAGELWTIENNGTITKRGHFGVVPPNDGNGNSYDPAHVGKPWELSGDIVFLANEGKPVGFATVRDCPNPPSSSGCSKTDTLIEIDMTKLNLSPPGDVTKAVRGKILKKFGCGADGIVGGSMFGIAAWNESVFGFSRTGRLVRVETVDGGGCLVKYYPNREFSGAGVNTLAPIVVPPLQ